MKVLHIITQKPHSTGSGTYMCGMIDGFKKMGHTQGVIAGISSKDENAYFDADINFYPVIYDTNELDFPVVGMSDEMPYKSTKYRDLTDEMVNKLKNAFKKQLDLAIKEFKPDIIICHHLYLITSFVREVVKDILVVGICHATCLRQFNSHDLEKKYIFENIRKLDAIFSLHDELKNEIIELFEIKENKVFTLGSGFNDKVFYSKNIDLSNDKINLSFAGKVCRYKGMLSLIKSLSKLNYPSEFITLNVAGFGNNIDEYNEIVEEAKKCKYKVNFLGKLNQDELADLFRKTHIFILPSFFEGLPLVVLEALSCGANVLATDTPGVKEWIGDEINNSKKIDYIYLPKMKSIGVPFEEELENFESCLSEKIQSNIDNILKYNTRNKTIDMNEKTWSGLSSRITKFISKLK